MNKKTKQMFLIILLIFLLLSITTANATQNNQTKTQQTIKKTNTQNTQENNTTYKENTNTEKTKNNNQKEENEKTDPTLIIKFINNPNDEISTEDYLFTHKDQEYTLNITLYDEQTNTPITSTIQLYLLDDLTPINITIPETGHTQTTQKINKIGQMMTIYATYQGNQHYNPAESQTLLVDSETYSTTITVEKIENQEINSTITITGSLLANEEIPIENANITISINNQKITNTTTTKKGQYTQNIKLENLPTQEMLSLTVKYNSPNDKYEDASTTTYFDIEKITNTITLDKINNTKIATSINITGNITNQNSPYNENITITITDNKNNTVYTNEISVNNGQYNTTFLPTSTGTYQIIIKTPENKYYTQQTITDTFNIEKTLINFEIDQTHPTLIGDNISISGQIKNEDNQPITNTPITIKTKNEKITTITTDKNGKFKYTQYQFQKIPKQYDEKIYLEIEETENYNNTTTSINYILLKRNVNITIKSNEKTKVTQKLHITGNIKDANNTKIIPPGTISIQINNQTIITKLAIDDNGNYSTDLIIQKEYINKQKLIIEATFTPQKQDIYNDKKSNNITVKVELLQTKIEITSNNTKIDTPVNITINLSDENKKRINTNITLKIYKQNTTVYNKLIELENGTKTIQYKASNNGTYNIIAQYNGEENLYTKSTKEYNITVEKIKTQIILEKLNKTQYVNNTITIQGQILDNNNNKIENITIIIEITNNTTTKKQQITTDNSTFKSTYTPTNTDNITITATIQENQKYYETKNQTTIQIIKHNTTIQSNPIKENIRYTDTINLTGKIITEEKQPVNGTIQIRINNQSIIKENLDNGQYKVPIKINQTGKENNITIIFQENNAYKTSQKTIKFNTTPIKTKITTSKINDTIINTNITINGTLKDYNNNNITDKIIITLNKENNTQEIEVKDGKFNFTYTTKTVGKNNITITYNADNIHYQKTNTTITYNTQKADIEVNNITSHLDNKEKTITITANITTQTNITPKNIPVTITIKDKQYNTTTNKNGTIQITTDTLIPDTYTPILKIIETENTNSKTINMKNITINKDTIDIQLNKIKNITYNEKYTLNGLITDKYQRPLKNISIQITINNKTLNTQTNNNGTFKINIIEFNAGTNNITIKVPETTTSNEKTITTIFTAKKQKINITLEENDNIKALENITIKGQILDKNNKKIINQTVTLQINNKSYTLTTNNNGQFHYTIENAKLGTYNINVKFSNPNYITQTINKTLQVTKQKVNINIANITSTIGENITLKAVITDEKGQKVSGGNLVFKLNGRTLRNDNRFDTNNTEVHKFTLKNGIIEYTIKADLYLRNAKNISASYSGSYKYESAKSNTHTANIRLRYAQINITSINTAKQHENITITAHITDKMKNSNYPLIDENSSVILKINDVTLRDEKGNVIRVPVINNTAQYTFNVGIKSSTYNNSEKRNYTITAIYDSINYYPTARNNTNFTVEKSIVNINITEISCNNTMLRIKANLTDYLGYNLIGNNKVCIKINGITYKENNHYKYYTVTNGVINIDDIDVHDRNVKSVEIVTGQRQAYHTSRLKVDNIKIEA